MDVINLSLGEPEVEPSRDIVARALDAAAAAGVVPVVAAGNDFEDFGARLAHLARHRRSGRSPSPPSRAPTRRAAARLADFSSAGPDAAVAAAEARRQRARRLDPVLRARRPLGGDVGHVDGDAADRRRRGAAARAASRPGRWPMLKAALIETGTAVKDGGQRRDADPRRRWARRPARRPTCRSCSRRPPRSRSGSSRPGATAPAHVEPRRRRAAAPACGTSPSSRSRRPPRAPPRRRADRRRARAALDLTATVDGRGDRRRPDRVRPADARHRHPPASRSGSASADRRSPRRRRPPLTAPGLRAGNTRGKPSLVSRYRYPDVPAGRDRDGRAAGARSRCSASR